MNLIRKRYDLPPVTSAGERVTLNAELDKGSERVMGMLLTADREDHLYHRGTLEVQVSGSELIAENHHARLLMSGLGVGPGERFLPFDHCAGNGSLKVSYQDNQSPTQSFSGSYRVSLYLAIRPNQNQQ